MENRNNRGLRSLIIVALIIAVVGISVAFAALGQTLTITGTGQITATDWDIHWSAAEGDVIVSSSENVSEGINSGLPATLIEITGIILEAPGDKVEWTITASNAGDIDAELESVTNLLSKVITFDELEESDLTENDIIVTLKKAGGGTITAGDTLAAGTTQDYVLTIEFNPLAETLPDLDVEIAITALFPWIQK